MDIYALDTLSSLLSSNTYPGRGIVLGCTPSGRAAAAYFIMGRSQNSRNRVFVERDGAVYTEPFDPSKVQDPSLIIYAAVRSVGDKLIVTNGDQTDTVAEGLEAGKNFFEALESRQFEPDAPNLTPRISGMVTFGRDGFCYDMSILKSADAEGTACARYGFRYPAIRGVGHFLHTYVCDGDPIPTFQGEPERVAIDDDIDRFAAEIWDSLNADNKISLYVRFQDADGQNVEDRIINKFTR
ncbi:MAG: inosine monophosphate cyclohydrolase [Clostridiales bacterium]|nr:inosine monophosphate cyclohydrolase [Clostridiales bacterium]